VRRGRDGREGAEGGEGRERGGRARLGYLSGAPKFLVTKYHTIYHKII